MDCLQLKGMSRHLKAREKSFWRSVKKHYFNIKPTFSVEPKASLKEAVLGQGSKGSFFYLQPGSCSPREERRGGSLSSKP